MHFSRGEEFCTCDIGIALALHWRYVGVILASYWRYVGVMLALCCQSAERLSPEEASATGPALCLLKSRPGGEKLFFTGGRRFAIGRRRVLGARSVSKVELPLAVSSFRGVALTPL